MQEISNFEQLVETAIVEFVQNEGELLEIDVSERCITHSFANYLDKAIYSLNRNWKVDVEYNRHKKDIKTTGWETQPKKFTPDIVVHERQTDKNMLAIEIKKSTNKNRKAHASDNLRLENLVNSDKYHYKYGLYLLFETGKDYNLNAVNYKCYWYVSNW